MPANRPNADARADFLLARDLLDEDGARRIAAAVVDRHARMERDPDRAPTPADHARALSAAVESIVEAGIDPVVSGLREVERGQRRFLEANADRLLARAAADRILAAAHSLSLREVRLAADGTTRIEPEEAAAPGDVCVEVAGLSVELLAVGERAAAERLLSHYAGEADDFKLYALIEYYERACALERAAAAAKRLRTERDGGARRFLLAAVRRLVRLAEVTERRSDHPPVVIALSGQVASGKSTVAKALAARLAAPRVVADRVRDQLLHGVPGRERHEATWTEAFEPGFHARVYSAVLKRGDEALASGRPVVLDACFPTLQERDAAQALARRHTAPFRFVECRVDPATQKERLEARDADTEAGGWNEIAQQFAERFEAPTELAVDERIEIDTSGSVEAAVEAVVARLPAWALLDDDARVLPGARRLPQPPKAVTFDCWQTLLYEEDWEHAHARRVDALLRAARDAGREPTQAEARAAFDASWHRHMTQWHLGVATGAAEVALHALRLLGFDEPEPALESLVDEYEEASHTSRVLAIDGARKALETLANAGVRRALVCDTGLTPGRVVRRHLERQGLLEYLEVCAFSDEVGVPKPDSRIFRAALAPLGVAPEHAVHIGDLRRTDVAGARDLGMGAIRIRARNDDLGELAEADAVADDYERILALLGLGETSSTA